jgi:hypothetical protein
VTAHPARLAWSACGLSLVLAALGFLFMALNRTQPDGPVVGYWAENAALALAFPTVGALVAARRSGNPIGWIFMRDHVELDSLSEELRGIVADTMQPAHVLLWLREAPR